MRKLPILFSLIFLFSESVFATAGAKYLCGTYQLDILGNESETLLYSGKKTCTALISQEDDAANSDVSLSCPKETKKSKDFKWFLNIPENRSPNLVVNGFSYDCSVACYGLGFAENDFKKAIVNTDGTMKLSKELKKSSEWDCETYRGNKSKDSYSYRPKASTADESSVTRSIGSKNTPSNSTREIKQKVRTQILRLRGRYNRSQNRRSGRR